MLPLPTTKSCGAAGADAVFQDRVVAKSGTGTVVPNQGNAIRQEDISTIVCAMYDLTTAPTNVVSNPTITTAAVSDTLTADAIWSRNGMAIDAIGRNFLHQVPGTNFPTAGHWYRVKYTITLTDGTPIIWWHDHQAK